MHQQSYNATTTAATIVPPNGLHSFGHGSHYAQMGAILPQSSSTAFHLQLGEDRLNGNAMDHYLLERNDLCIAILYPKVALKSSGIEKRYVCPPPSIYPYGNGWQYRQEEMLRKGESVQGALLAAFIEDCDQNMQKLNLNQTKRCFAADTLYISPTYARQDFSLSVKMFYGNGSYIGQFKSKSIKVISKPCKMSSLRTTDMYIASGTYVSLFQTLAIEGSVRTRYLHINNGHFYGSPTEWSSIQIHLINDDKPEEFQDGHVHYGATVKLVSSITGTISHRLVIRKVERNTVILEDNGPVLQLEKCAFYVKDTVRLYLGVLDDEILQFQAVPCPNQANKELINDSASWSIVGIDKYDCKFIDVMSPVRAPLTPMPMISSLNLNGGGSNAAMLDGASYYTRPQVRFNTMAAETWSRCANTCLCVVPDVTEFRGERLTGEQFQSCAIPLTPGILAKQIASEEQRNIHVKLPFGVLERQQLSSSQIPNNSNSEEQRNPPLIYDGSNVCQNNLVDQAPTVNASLSIVSTLPSVTNKREELLILEQHNSAAINKEKNNLPKKGQQFQSCAISLTQGILAKQIASEEQRNIHVKLPFGVLERQQLSSSQIPNNSNSEEQRNPPLIYDGSNVCQNNLVDQASTANDSLSIVSTSPSVTNKREELLILEQHNSAAVNKEENNLPKKRRQRCGLCIGCQIKYNCGQCRPCRYYKRGTICIQRRCEKIWKEKKPKNRKRRQRCHRCTGCLKINNCGNCAPCKNDKSNQLCRELRCKNLLDGEQFQSCAIPLTPGILAKQIASEEQRNIHVKLPFGVLERQQLSSSQIPNNSNSEEQRNPPLIYDGSNVCQNNLVDQAPTVNASLSIVSTLPSVTNKREELLILEQHNSAAINKEKNNLPKKGQQFQSCAIPLTQGILAKQIASEEQRNIHVKLPFGVLERQQLSSSQIPNNSNSEEQRNPPLIYDGSNVCQNNLVDQASTANDSLSIVSTSPSVTNKREELLILEQHNSAAVNKEENNLPKKRKQRCGLCIGCQIKYNCGQCPPCIYHRGAICKQRRCEKILKEKKPKNRKRRQRCHRCTGCLKINNCGNCAPCKNDKSHQVCRERRCKNLLDGEQFQSCAIPLTQGILAKQIASEEQRNIHVKLPFGVLERQQLSSSQIPNNSNSEEQRNPPLIYDGSNVCQNNLVDQAPTVNASLSIVSTLPSVTNKREELLILEQHNSAAINKEKNNLPKKGQQFQSCAIPLTQGILAKQIASEEQRNIHVKLPFGVLERQQLSSSQIPNNSNSEEQPNPPLIYDGSNVCQNNLVDQASTANDSLSIVSTSPSVTNKREELLILEQHNSAAVNKEENNLPKKRRQRCGLCIGCQIKYNCGQCRPCRYYKRGTICIQRRCEKIWKEKKPKNRKRRQRCHRCTGCLKINNCGNCAPCKNDKSNQLCRELRCKNLLDVETQQSDLICGICNFHGDKKRVLNNHMKIHSSSKLKRKIKPIPLPGAASAKPAIRNHPNRNESPCIEELEQSPNRQNKTFPDSERQLDPPPIYAECNIKQEISLDLEPFGDDRVLFAEGALTRHEVSYHPDQNEESSTVELPCIEELEQHSNGQINATLPNYEEQLDSLSTNEQYNINQSSGDDSFSSERLSFNNEEFEELRIPKYETDFEGFCEDDKYDKSVFRIRNLQLHMTSHKNVQYSCNISSQILNDEVVLENHTETNKFQCFTCKKHFPTLDVLHSHINEHSVAERILVWKEHLEISRILHNQPFVKLKNLDINSIDLFSLADFERQNKNCKQLSVLCNVCKTRCKSKKQLERHMKAHTEGKYKCEICQIPFTKQTLTLHKYHYHIELQKKRVLGVKSVVCTMCKFNCRNYERLERHMKIHTEGDLKCKNCGILFTRSTFTLHNKRCHPEMQFSEQRNKKRNLLSEEKGKRCGECIGCEKKDNCGDCDPCRNDKTHQTCKQRRCEKLRNERCDQLRSEKENTRDSQKVSVTLYQCKTCKVFCCTKGRLYQHQKLHDGAFKCKYCNVRFTKQSLWSHQKSVHPTKWKKRIFIRLQCDICKTICPSRQRLEQHIKVHSNGEFICKVCQIPFSKTGLALHEKRDHPEMRWNEHTSNTSENISSEEVVQLQTKSYRHYYARKSCTKMMSNDASLENHAKISSFECYVCERPFPTLSALHIHINKHSVYEQWIDPISVHLSNWSPEKSREILQNQPLVMLDKLDINSINLKSLSDFGQPSGVENIVNDVIDLSSDEDSDVEIVPEIVDTHYCYFCNKAFCSLLDLGDHVKICPAQITLI